MCKENNVSWDYFNTAYGFYFTFIRNNDLANVLANVQAKNTNNDLTNNESIIYHKIKSNTKIQKLELSLALNKSEKTVQRVLATLTQKGYIKRIGSNQYGYWEVLK